MVQLRPFQKQALSALATTRCGRSHVLCIAPTGSGKSLIYETAAAQTDSRTLLITPLVALARQQFKKFKQLNIPVSLGAGGSSDPPPENRTGTWIMSPETLLYPSKKSILNRWRPNLLVVDECHCLWEWGESFRPAFSNIPALLTELAIHRSLWLTATLPFEARQNLRDLLPKPLTEIGEFNLPHRLCLVIVRVSLADRASALLHWLRDRHEAGIVFVPTREATLRISRLLQATGRTVITYHGGMSAEERKAREAQVRNGMPEIIVSTSAFGMGMDYPHLKFVVLWQAPTSLLALVQTVGRVGRDFNQTGNALVFWDSEDFKLLEWTVKDSRRRIQELRDVMTFLEAKGCRLVELKRYFDRASPDICCMRCDACQKLRYTSKAKGEISTRTDF